MAINNEYVIKSLKQALDHYYLNAMGLPNVDFYSISDEMVIQLVNIVLRRDFGFSSQVLVRFDNESVDWNEFAESFGRLIFSYCDFLIIYKNVNDNPSRFFANNYILNCLKLLGQDVAPIYIEIKIAFKTFLFRYKLDKFYKEQKSISWKECGF